jgi:hypothetical protein
LKARCDALAEWRKPRDETHNLKVASSNLAPATIAPCHSWVSAAQIVEDHRELAENLDFGRLMPAARVDHDFLDNLDAGKGSLAVRLRDLILAR